MSRWFWHWSETFPTTFKLGLWRSFNYFHYFAHHQRKKFWSVEIGLDEEGIGKYVNVKTFLIPSFLCQSSGPELVATRYMYPTQPTVTMCKKEKKSIARIENTVQRPVSLFIVGKPVIIIETIQHKAQKTYCQIYIWAFRIDPDRPLLSWPQKKWKWKARERSEIQILKCFPLHFHQKPSKVATEYKCRGKRQIIKEALCIFFCPGTLLNCYVYRNIHFFNE